jgi:hypothetical protein
MVDVYYTLQAFRIRSANQAQALEAQAEPNRLTTWFGERYWQLECQIRRVLDAYSLAQPVARWARANRGIGPVLAAGLLAHLDANPPATVGAWWRFQGYDPTIEWLGKEKARALVVEVAPETTRRPLNADELLELGRRTNRNPLHLEKLAMVTARHEPTSDEPFRLSRASMIAALAKRPWNARLKTLSWKLGESMVKRSGHDDCLYGQLYKQRKAYEQSRNDEGLYAAQAERMLQEKRIGDDTEAIVHYRQGRLPPGHIHARAKRWSIKILISHWHECATVVTHGRLPIKPFAIERLGHQHWIKPMHMDVIPGWAELRLAAMA